MNSLRMMKKGTVFLSVMLLVVFVHSMDFDSWNDMIASEKASIVAAEQELQQTKTKEQNAEHTLDTVKKVIESHTKTVVTLQQELASIRGEKEQLEKQIKINQSTDQSVMALEEKLVAIQAKEKFVEEAKDALATQVQNLEQQVVEKENALQKTQDELEKIKSEKSAEDSELALVKKQLADIQQAEKDKEERQRLVKEGRQKELNEQAERVAQGFIGAIEELFDDVINNDPWWSSAFKNDMKKKLNQLKQDYTDNVLPLKDTDVVNYLDRAEEKINNAARELQRYDNVANYIIQHKEKFDTLKKEVGEYFNTILSGDLSLFNEYSEKLNNIILDIKDIDPRVDVVRSIVSALSDKQLDQVKALKKEAESRVRKAQQAAKEAVSTAEKLNKDIENFVQLINALNEKANAYSEFEEKIRESFNAGKKASIDDYRSSSQQYGTIYQLYLKLKLLYEKLNKEPSLSANKQWVAVKEQFDNYNNLDQEKAIRDAIGKMSIYLPVKQNTVVKGAPPSPLPVPSPEKPVTEKSATEKPVVTEQPVVVKPEEQSVGGVQQKPVVTSPASDDLSVVNLQDKVLDESLDLFQPTEKKSTQGQPAKPKEEQPAKSQEAVKPPVKTLSKDAELRAKLPPDSLVSDSKAKEIKNTLDSQLISLAKKYDSKLLGLINDKKSGALAQFLGSRNLNSKIIQYYNIALRVALREADQQRLSLKLPDFNQIK